MIYTIITDGEQIKESSPNAEWLEISFSYNDNKYVMILKNRSTDERKLRWKIPYTHNGTGSLSATVMTVQNDSEQQPLTTSSIINVYFVGENGLFSSIDFDLICEGYRISLLKKKILSGKFL